MPSINKRGRLHSVSDDDVGQSKNSIRETTRPKPSKVDIAEELGFKQSRLPDIGPGALKPYYGRGGVALSTEYYLGEKELKINEKKGSGIGESVKTKKIDTNKPKWSDM